MESFKSYLTEAMFGGASLIKVSQLIRNVLQRKLGVNLFRYDGENGFENISIGGREGKGMLLFTDGSEAYRVNFLGSEVDSISIWKSYRLNTPADFTMNLSGLNIVKAIDVIVPILKNPRTGEFNFPLTEDVIVDKMVTEARRVSPEEFYRKIAPEIPHSNHKEVHVSDIVSAAKKHDLVVNQYFKSQKGQGKMMFNIIPAGMAPNTDIAAIHDGPIPNTPQRTYHISVTPQDAISKKFLSPKDDAKVTQIIGQIRKTLDNPTPTPNDMKDPDSIFAILADLVELIIHKNINSLIVYGGPGTGKCFLGIEKLKFFTPETSNSDK